MAKATPEIWGKARALFEADKSFRDIAKHCPPLDSSNIAKIAKKEGWQRGVLPPIIRDKARVDAEFTTVLPRLISDKVRVDAEFTTLLPQQQEVVVREIDERNKHIKFFTSATIKNCKTMMQKVDDDADFADHKLVQDTLSKGKETVLGKEPAQVINNTNAQQNNNDKDYVINIVDAQPQGGV